MGSQTDLNDLSPDEPLDDKPAGERKPSQAAQRKQRTKDNELRTRIVGCFDRIATALETRGDEQMAEILRDDAEIMSQGLISLTRPFAALRAPLVMVLAVIEPALAFGRIMRLSAERWQVRRMERAAEQEAQQQAEAEAGPVA